MTSLHSGRSGLPCHSSLEEGFYRSTFKLILIKQNGNFSSSVVLATFQVLDGCLWLDRADKSTCPSLQRVLSDSAGLKG